MSTSAVTCDQAFGFWSPDWLLEVFAFQLGNQVLREGDTPLRPFGLRLVELSRAGLNGCLDLGFDGLDSSHRRTVCQAVERVRLASREHPEDLEPSYLNDRGFGTVFQSGVRPEHLERLCRAVTALLEGRWGVTLDSIEADPRVWLLGGQTGSSASTHD